jgi:hypothetical protein
VPRCGVFAGKPCATAAQVAMPKPKTNKPKENLMYSSRK